MRTPAPVTADYRDRDKLVAFWERATRQHAEDQLSPRMLAEQYLQRFRERGDLDDVLRAQRAAQRSLRAQPRGNIVAKTELASALTALHRFDQAREVIRSAEGYANWQPALAAREAALDLELGQYERARVDLDRAKSPNGTDAFVDTTRARYLELTGHLAEARRLLERPIADIDDHFDAPAQARSWYHFRAGELAFEAGDVDGALAQETTALTLFPDNAQALSARARFESAIHRWPDALRDATRAADLIPLPETLGYKADAQRALGDAAGAARTDDLIATIERIGDTQHVSDRLIAVYYSEHHLHPADAVRIAKRDLAARHDVFSYDTLAWAQAMAGHWTEARAAIGRALRYDTEDARLQYHAGMIALHFGDSTEAKRRLSRALALNPHFHPTYADDARRELARL